jgi:phosphate:Na+ symporter
MIAERLRGGSGMVEAETPHAAIEDLEDFLTELAVPPDAEAVRNRLSALLHMADHLHRLGHRAAQSDRMRPLASEPALRRPALAYAALLSRAAGSPADPQIAFRLRRLGGVIARRSARLRRSVLLREHAGLLRTRDVFEITDALRWLDRSVNHAERIVHYGSVAAQEAPTRADAARDGRG